MCHPQEFILTLSCRDAPGSVPSVAGLPFAGGCNSIDTQRFGGIPALNGPKTVVVR